MPLTANGTQWLKIQKTFGPIQCRTRRNRLSVWQCRFVCFDSALTVAGLTLSLDGWGLICPEDLAAKQFKPTFHTQRALALDYRNGPIEIGGSFLETERDAHRRRQQV